MNGSATFETTESRGVPTINQLPVVSVASPVAGAMFPAGAGVPINVSASDGDDGISRVELKVDGATIATFQSPPYASRIASLAPGAHTVVAVATDTRGASTTSVPVSFTVSTVPGVTLTRRYVYDGQQRLCKVIEPETGSTVMAYDAAGNLAWSAAGLDLPSATSCDLAAAEASGRVVRRSYDARNRLATLRFPDRNGDVDYSYTPDGLVQQAIAYNDAGSTSATTQYQYNKRRLLVGETLSQSGAVPRSLGYTYSTNGHLAGHVYPGGRPVDYAPNAMGKPTRVGDYVTGVSYYANGGIKQFTYGNGVVHTTSQNARRLPARIADSNVVALETSFDPNGNVVAIADLQLGANYSRQMQYDDRDRLVAAGSPMFGGAGWHRFRYDALDNIRSWSLDGVKADQYWYDAHNRLTNIRNDNGATTVGLAYDVQGDLANKNGQGFRFDYGNRLREAVGKGSYRYDADGLRVLATRTDGAAEESLYRRGGPLVYQFNRGSGLQTETLYLDSKAVAQLETVSGATTVKYLHTDALGSPVASTGSAGQLLERTHYEPYGRPINRTVDGVGHTGHKMDGDTGLSYMQQRYMDPQLGVFLSVDPVAVDTKSGAKFNRYAYALNNPYKFIDPDGRDEEWFSNVDQMGNPGFGNELGDDAFHYNGKALVAASISGATLPGILRSIAAPFARAAVPEMQGRTVAGVKVGDGPADTRAALEDAAYMGTRISNDAGTESGTLHNVPSMKMDVRVMDGGPKHPPRVSVTREGNPRQPVNPENGKNFGNIPKGEQRAGSHIYYREKP